MAFLNLKHNYLEYPVLDLDILLNIKTFVYIFITHKFPGVLFKIKDLRKDLRVGLDCFQFEPNPNHTETTHRRQTTSWGGS